MDDKSLREALKAIWDTFDGLFKAVTRHERKADELEGRIRTLEERLARSELKTTEDNSDEHHDGGGEAATKRPRLATSR